MWTEREEQYLKDNAASKTARELSEGLSSLGLGKSPDAVRMRCRKMKYAVLGADRHQWTEAEEAYLRQNYGKVKLGGLAKHLKLGVGAVKHHIYAMGLNNGEMKQVTPWVTRLLDKIDDTGKTLYDLSVELWQQGKNVSVESDASGKMALFCRERRE